MFKNHNTKAIYEKKVENRGERQREKERETEGETERETERDRERQRENITKTTSSPSQMFVKIGALKNFAILIGSGY